MYTQFDDNGSHTHESMTSANKMAMSLCHVANAGTNQCLPYTELFILKYLHSCSVLIQEQILENWNQTRLLDT